MYYLEYLGYLPIFAFFYLIGIPIWLVIIHGRVRELKRKIRQLEEGKTIQEATTPSAPPPQQIPQQGVPPASMEQRAEEFRKTQKEIPQRKVAEGKSFEEQVGEHWFQWLGIAALILALIFFMKWAFDNGWIGPTGRTVIGYILAGGAIIAGDRLRGKYGVWSLAFTGGGALASYSVTWIAQHTYHLFPSTLSLIIFTLTTVIVCLLAGYYKAIPLAAFGIIGGMLTPLLTGEGGSIIGLLSYILILDIGVLVLGHVQHWRVLNALTFICTLLWEFYALVEGDIQREYALTFMAVFGAIYLLVPALYNIKQKMKSELGDLIVLIGNGIAHFGLLIWWLERTPGLRESIDAPIALVFSVIFLLFSYAIYQSNKEDTPLVLSGLSLTILFASLAIPLQLGEAWTVFAWSVEATFLLWISLELRDKRIQLFAWPVLCAAYIWYFFVPIEGTHAIVALEHSGFYLFLFWVVLFVGIALLTLGDDNRSSQSLLPFVISGGAILLIALLFNTVDDRRSSLDFTGRLIEFAGLVGGSYIVLWQAKRKWPLLSENEKQGFSALGICTQVVTIAYLTYEFREAVDSKKIFASAENPWQIKRVGTSLLWGVYGTTTLIAGFQKNWKSIRIFSILLLLLTVGKLTLIDLASLGTGARIIGFTVMGVLLVGSSFLYQHNKEKVRSFFTNAENNSPPSSPTPTPPSINA